MTPQQRKAMELALEALEPFTTPNWAGSGVDKANEAFTALQEALMSLQDRAQDSKRPIESDYVSQVAYTRALEAYCDGLAQPAQQEPAFYLHEDDRLMTPDLAKFVGLDLNELQPLYTSPPQRTWVGLTDENLANCSGHEVRWAFVNGWLSAEAAHGIKE